MKAFRAGLALAAVTMLWMVPLWLYGGTAVTMDGPMTDSNAVLGQAYNKNFPVNMDDKNIDVAALTMVYYSTMPAAQSFTDGTASSATITVVSATALSTAAASGKFTAVSTTVAAGVTGSGVVLFGTNNGNANIKITGPPGGLNYTIGGNVALADKSSGTAVNFANAVNLSSNTSLVTAAQSGSNAWVTLTCINAGTFCNSYAVTSTSATQVSTAAFVSGANPVSVTIGGYVYRAVSDFAVGATTAAMMNNLSALVVASSNTTGVTSTATLTCGSPSSCGVMYATSTTNGTAGNLIALASSNNLAISTGNVFMTGGQDNAILCINGTCLTANKHWYPAASTAGTADSLYAAINSSFTGVVTSTDSGATAVIYTTAATVGTATNYVITSSTQAALKVGGAAPTTNANGSGTGAYIGGTNASFALGSSVLSIANHNYASALGLYVSSAAGTSQLFYSTASVGGTATQFAQGTTYYAIPLTANTMSLSLTSTGAVAGTAITFVSSQTKTTTDTYTLNITTVTGTFSYGIYVGNDGANFTQIGSTISGQAAYPITSSATFHDLGTVDYKWLQLRVVSPTAGAVSVSTSLHGEKR